jgi:hypothetical protein
MVTVANVSNFGRVVLRVDPTQVWEILSGDSGGLAPDPGGSQGAGQALSQGAGQALSQYAGLVEGTLGTREGATAMFGIANPTGYLELDEQAITGVTPAGTGTVDGQAVTEYRVSVQPAELASDPSASTEEATTINAALATLNREGLSATTDQIAIDAQGFIVQSITTYQFSDGGSVTVQANFSNFGCAGTVLMPGQTGPTTPPAGCVSPDSPQGSAESSAQAQAAAAQAAAAAAQAAASTTTTNPATTTTPTTRTTIPHSGSTTTTTPSPTTPSSSTTGGATTPTTTNR